MLPLLKEGRVQAGANSCPGASLVLTSLPSSIIQGPQPSSFPRCSLSFNYLCCLYFFNPGILHFSVSRDTRAGSSRPETAPHPGALSQLHAFPQASARVPVFLNTVSLSLSSPDTEMCSLPKPAARTRLALLPVRPEGIDSLCLSSR